MKKIQATLITNQTTSNTSEAHTLHQKSNFGTKQNQKILYSTYETYFLTEQNKMQVQNFQNKTITKQALLKKFTNQNKNFLTNYTVFKDLTKSGYTIKTALKFGAAFRVYQKNTKHSKWICYPIKENSKIKTQDFAAQNRVAHSTKKNLLMAIVDDENSTTYYEIKWIQPQ
ncbi:tRNA-intron lyase [archaeon]|nr:tRNA-intron lyase [archaeon]MBT7128190.1 tRNA-intron lyase [archaeon]